jgi:hypothetical protein
LEVEAFAPILIAGDILALPEDHRMLSAALHDPAAAPPARPAATAAANPLVEWILAEGWDARSLPDLVRGLCQQMLAMGLPLCRMRLHVRTLHPQYLGTSYTWTRGRAEIEEFNATYAILNAECYQASPFKAIFDDGVGGVRRRLDIPGLAHD